MTGFFNLLADVLTLASNDQDFGDCETVHRRFVRDRMEWVMGRVDRGTPFSDIAGVLGVPNEVLEEEIWLRSSGRLLSRGPAPQRGMRG